MSSISAHGLQRVPMPPELADAVTIAMALVGAHPLPVEAAARLASDYAKDHPAAAAAYAAALRGE